MRIFEAYGTNVLDFLSKVDLTTEVKWIYYCSTSVWVLFPYGMKIKQAFEKHRDRKKNTYRSVSQPIKLRHKKYPHYNKCPK